ncbi:MAG: Maltose-binding protein [Microgenomates group bacterium GW2011_GWC1_47_20]|uniref:Maltose-binding protein n=1 Tax=Candidatus Amesbacteria bacterium GW2011_GWC2_45_19 TaxID=1618366 RepID=A0A0G1M3F0_9BACT|nr:MAG: Maltose-binding protein [Candidatus Amesbacteria bacterium GW2011_GWC2_45_19]KKU69337.1 MAG: Maltose-binding protein [Microgenomates group bacterium GW2011_GWC1_47_20]
MDLPPQPLSSPIQPQVPASSVQRPPSKFPLSAIIMAVVVLIILVVGFFAAKSILSLNKKNQPVELTYWGLWESESVVKPLIDEYQSAHLKVKINYIFQSPREYRERLQTALSMSKGPDIFRIHNSWVPMFKNDLAPLPPAVYSASEFESVFYPTVKSDLRLSGNYVAVPLEIDGLAMYINDDLLAASALSVPATWEDLRVAAKALSVCDSVDGTCSSGDRILISGVALGTADNVDHWQDILAILMLQNNVNLNAPAGASAEDALSYYSVFNRSDHIWDSTLPPSTQAFAAGKLAIYFAPSWRVFDLQAINPQIKFSVYPIPQLPLDPARGEKPITWASYWVEGVNKKSPNAAAAWEFLKFLSSKESLAKLYASSGRIFGEPYSRRDMTDSSQFVQPYLSQAPDARSWYIASNTFDGPTGINTRLSSHFADAVNSVNQGRSPAEAVKTLNAGINQVLSQYGLASPLTP